MNDLIYIDVGARWGNNTRMSGGNKYNFDVYFDNVIAHGFEPDPEEFERLKNDSNNIYYKTALDKTKGKRTLYIMTSPDWSSFYRPDIENSKQFEGVSYCNIIDKEVEVETDTLDNVLDDGDFIKIDTEGSEYDIMLGGKDLFKDRIMCAEVEVYFYPIREDQATFGEIHKFMLDNKFQLFNISKNKYMRSGFPSIWLTKGQMLWGDALYLKDYRYVDDTNKLHKLYNLALSFGYPDYATEIAKKLRYILPNSDYTFKRE